MNSGANGRSEPRSRRRRAARRVGGGRAGVRVLAAGLAVALACAPLRAQSVRGWVGSTIQMVEVRPLAQVEGGCVPDEPCYLAQDEELAMVGTQDLHLTAFGFGLQGVSATVMLRGRAQIGGALDWPRSDDHFDAVLAYGQLVRDGFTVRLGRQEIRSGLGFPSFDGASVAWTSNRAQLRAEGYAGRSLARGLREPERDAFRALDDFFVDQSAWLFGGSARFRTPALSVTGRYQRELLGDRSGLASERGALDLTFTTPRGRLVGSADYDFGAGRPGKARVAWTSPFSDGRWLVELQGERYVPYFSLSTIWGFFEPVSYHGVGARVAWTATPELAVWATGGWRTYGDTRTATVLRALADDGKRIGLGARWALRPRVSVDARYEMELGPGGFLSSLDAAVKAEASERLDVTATLSTFQQIEQYRLGDGRGVGGGLSADLRVRSRIRVLGGGSLLSLTGIGSSAPDTWLQARAWTSLRIDVGRDPGLRTGRAP